MRALPFALVLAFVCTACSSDSTPTTPTTATPPSPVTEIFKSSVVRLGTTSHTFVAAKAGTVNLTLTNIDPSAVAATQLVIGIGIPTLSSAGCSLTTTKTTAPDTSTSPVPQLTALVDGGTFCVKVSDVGNLTVSQQAFFTLSIERP